MSHQPNLSKRETFEQMKKEWAPIFAAYDGERDALVKEMSDLSGLTPDEVEEALFPMLDEWVDGDDIDKMMLRRNGPWNLAEAAVWGSANEYKD